MGGKPAPYTLHPEPDTLHPEPHTLYCILNPIHNAPAGEERAWRMPGRRNKGFCEQSIREQDLPSLAKIPAYRSTSLIRNSADLGHYIKTMPGLLWRS